MSRPYERTAEWFGWAVTRALQEIPGFDSTDPDDVTPEAERIEALLFDTLGAICHRWFRSFDYDGLPKRDLFMPDNIDVHDQRLRVACRSAVFDVLNSTPWIAGTGFRLSSHSPSSYSSNRRRRRRRHRH